MFPRIARFRSVADLRGHLAALAAPIPLDDAPLSAAAGSPLARPVSVGGRIVGNRWAIHPMQGWDAAADGRPSEILLRRWRHFGASGAKFIWGGEAVAVVPPARSRICRTFSDCTTAPRNGLKSGCYPLDAFYKALPEAATVKQIKAAMEARG